MSYSGDDGSNGGGDPWEAGCDICGLLNFLKTTAESDSNRITRIQADVANIINLLRINLDTKFSWEVQVKEKCNSTTTKKYSGEKKGMEALMGITRDITKLLKDLQTTVCENDNAPVIPEWWQLRPEADRPQLVVLCAEKKADGTLGSAKYVVTIPHYRYTSLTGFSPFPKLEKGSYQGILTLTDNSKVIIYAKSILEARSVLYNIYQNIQADHRLDFHPKVGPIGNPNFQEITVYPKYGKYFATGARKTVPDWVVAYGNN